VYTVCYIFFIIQSIVTRTITFLICKSVLFFLSLSYFIIIYVSFYFVYFYSMKVILNKQSHIIIPPNYSNLQVNQTAIITCYMLMEEEQLAKKV